MNCVADAIKGGDIVCSVTTCRTPLIFDDMLLPGTHLVPTCLWNIDIKNILHNADKWVLGNTQSDNWLQRPAAMVDAEKVYSDLSEIVCSRKPGREKAEERTVMTHLGMGANDIAISYQVYKAAIEAGVGYDVQIMS